MARFTTAQAADRFINAGRATFTIKSEKTGAHFTFKADKKKDGSVTFLKLLNGPDNTANYVYVGLLRANEIVYTAKSKVSADAPSTKALAWALEQIRNDRLPNKLSIYHIGQCGHCRRDLTHPESLETGFGPVCGNR